jgi:crossover junction endodeoxyribonuclease RuvC
MNQIQVKRVILGIDPGLRIAGYSIIAQDYTNKTIILEADGLILSKIESLEGRIEQFYTFFCAKIKEYKVSEIALETPFLHKNPTNFLKLGYLRGILLLIAAQQKLIIHEFAPRSVKQALTGFGGAEKEQVARVITKLFPQLSLKTHDTSDAIAISLCALWAHKPAMQKSPQ